MACVKKFVEHFESPPGKLGLEHIRDYQLFLIQERGVSWSYFNQVVCALRFFYNTTLDKGWGIGRLPYQKQGRRLPNILSQEEVAAMLAATGHLRESAADHTSLATTLRLGNDLEGAISHVQAQLPVSIAMIVGTGTAAPTNTTHHSPIGGQDAAWFNSQFTHSRSET